MEKIETYFLVEALKGGNLLALEKIYKAYYSKLYRFAVKFSRSSLEPDDFVQQTFVTLWEKRERLKEEVLLDKQIFVICRNLIINQVKRDQKMENGFPSMDFHPFENNENEEQEEVALQKRKLKGIIDQMPEKRREIFLLHKINNLSYEEISENLGISKKTIANHIYLATAFLKQKI